MRSVRWNVFVRPSGGRPTASTSTTAYNAVYVALAEELDVPLVTADARISRAPGLRCEVSVLADGVA